MDKQEQSSSLEPKVSSSILDLIGNTPLIEIKLFRDAFPGVRVFAKAEWFNPGGSIKDRAAYAMIEAAEREGLLTHDKTIIDSTSGNTGIAYAMIGAAKGYKVELVMPENVSEERKQLVTAYGANIIFSSPFEGSDGAIRLCHEIVEKNPDKYYMPDQYNNENNPLAHYRTTGPEIIRQTEGKLTHFVAGIGTSGTFIGTTRALKEFNSSIKCIAVQPDDAWHGLEGLKHMPSSIVPGIWNEREADMILGAPTEECYELARTLAISEGILCGHSSGAVLWAVKRLLEMGERGIFVVIFPDSGDRYLSSGLYRLKEKKHENS